MTATEYRIKHKATNPNLHTVIREGQKWVRDPPKGEIPDNPDLWTVKEIEKEEDEITLESDETGEEITLDKPIDILNRQKWNYWSDGKRR